MPFNDPSLLFTMDLADISGTTITNRGSLGGTGTLVGSPTTNVAGKIAQAVSFSGSGQYINAGNILSTTGNITVASWVNLAAFPASGSGMAIIGKGYDSAVSPHKYGYWMDVRNASGTKYLRFSMFNGSTVVGAAWGITGWNTGDWHHVGGVWDGTNWIVYFDGAAKNTTAGAGPNASDSIVTLGSLYEGSITSLLNGALDDSRVYTRALSAAEMVALVAYTGANRIRQIICAGD